jgi:hypothetical protein
MATLVGVEQGISAKIRLSKGTDMDSCLQIWVLHAEILEGLKLYGQSRRDARNK